MTERGTAKTLPIHQILLLLMGTVILYLVFDFGQQVIVNYQRQEDLRRIERDVDSARAETRRLEARLDFVSSPQAAEAWAREQGRAKGDEVPVVILAPAADPESNVEDGAAAGAGTRTPRESWRDLFFGEP